MPPESFSDVLCQTTEAFSGRGRLPCTQVVLLHASTVKCHSQHGSILLHLGLSGGARLCSSGASLCTPHRRRFQDSACVRFHKSNPTRGRHPAEGAGPSFGARARRLLQRHSSLHLPWPSLRLLPSSSLLSLPLSSLRLRPRLLPSFCPAAFGCLLSCRVSSLLPPLSSFLSSVFVSQLSCPSSCGLSLAATFHCRPCLCGREHLVVWHGVLAEPGNQVELGTATKRLDLL